MADDALWEVKFKGKPYTLGLGDLTVGRMRKMKSWFGEDYGALSPFIVKLLKGDVDAMTCALWIVQGNAGENPPEPNFMDFSLMDFEEVDEGKDENPEPAPVKPATRTRVSASKSTT